MTCRFAAGKKQGYIRQIAYLCLHNTPCLEKACNKHTGSPLAIPYPNPPQKGSLHALLGSKKKAMLNKEITSNFEFQE